MASHAGKSTRNALMLEFLWKALRTGLGWRGNGLLAALLLLSVCLLRPAATVPGRVADWFVVVDITQSMNVRDYTLNGKNVSRLEYAKASIREGLRGLPCGSRVALGLFTERDTLSVTRPLEICRHYSALEQIVSRMDWRMAWAADSFISHGLYSAIEQTAKLGSDVRLLFITDGNQAPPANPKYMPMFTGKPGQVQGIILGSGKTTLSPIPKLDDRNEIGGYWTQEEALRFGNFGMAETLSVLAMEQGQHDRNAGHGPGNALLSTAHLSGLDEANLRRLSGITGLDYTRLHAVDAMTPLLLGRGMGRWRLAHTDLRPWLAVPVMIFLLVFFLPPTWLFWPGKIHRSFLTILKWRTS